MVNGIDDLAVTNLDGLDTLETIKADKLLRDLPLVKQSRLSVTPLNAGALGQSIWKTVRGGVLAATQREAGNSHFASSRGMPLPAPAPFFRYGLGVHMLPATA